MGFGEAFYGGFGGVACAAFEIIEHVEDLGFGEPLYATNAGVIVVLSTKRAAQAVALAHQFNEALVEDEVFDAAQSFPGCLAVCFIGVVVEHQAQLDGAGFVEGSV